MKRLFIALAGVLCIGATGVYVFTQASVSSKAGDPSYSIYYNIAEAGASVIPEDIIEERAVPSDVIPITEDEVALSNAYASAARSFFAKRNEVDTESEAKESDPFENEGVLEEEAIAEDSFEEETSDEETSDEPSFLHPALDTDPESITVLVNHEYSLPEDYVPSDMVSVNVKFTCSEKEDKRLMRKEASEALEALFAAANEDGISLCAISGYRSYERQNRLYLNNVRVNGKEYASRFSAPPGQSEHQTGLAMDISSASNGYSLDYELADKKEGKWLIENCSEYGFIVRYPKDKEEITGYAYEPWHFRYVGKRLAEYLTMNELTLDEYYGSKAAGEDLGYSD